MSESFVTTEQIWSRLNELSPQLRKHVRVHVHVYRGERWFLLQDELTSEHLRLNARAYALVGRLDGKCTLNTIYEYLIAHESADLSIAEVIDIIGRLQRLGAISNVLDKTTLDLVKQYRDKRRSVRLRKLISPLLIRLPVFDPDWVLERITPYFKSFFSVFGALVWLAIVLPAVVLSLQHWNDLGAAYSSDILKPSNLMLLWLLYPLMKLLHEFAHGICVKHWGGEVHEMGITLLVLTPIPYVDASAATVFKSKHRRMLVSGSGIMVELFIAAIALYVWLGASDGLLRDCAFGVFTIGAVSTVLFNANPLLKFDGYFIVQDLIEIPNLMARSAQYYRYLLKRYVLKFDNQLSPVTAKGERRWFLLYGLASSIYRLFILFFIVVFLSSKYFLLGVILGCWAVVQQILLPLIKGVKYLLLSPETEPHRQRTQRVVGAAALTCVLVIGLIPMPSSTQAQGVVWVPQQGEMFADVAGFVSEVSVSAGEQVTKGQLLLTLESAELEKTVTVMQNELLALDIRSELLRTLNPGEYALLQEDVAALHRSLSDLQAQKRKLKMVATSDGTFTPAKQGELTGHYFAQGELIAHVVNPTELVVRVAVPDVDSGLLQVGVKSATVRLAEALGHKIKASVVSEVPAADHKLPSAALGAAGGGGIAIAYNHIWCWRACVRNAKTQCRAVGQTLAKIAQASFFENSTGLAGLITLVLVMRLIKLLNPVYFIAPAVFTLAAITLPWGGDVDAAREVLADVDCVVQPGKIASLGSAVPGVLAAINVSRSDYVSAGTELAMLESDVEQASLQLAHRLASLNTATRLRQLNADFGTRTLQRNQSLFQKASISKQTLDQVKTEALIAEMQVQQERENTEVAGIEVVRAEAVLNRRTIRAPFDGAITERYKTVGEYVADDPILQIASLDPLHVEVIVPLTELGVVESGMQGNVTINLPGFDDKTFEATVRRIDPVADAASATYGVLLELPNPKLNIPSGVRCKLDFVAD